MSTITNKTEKSSSMFLRLLLGVTLIIFMIQSCCDGKTYQYTYELTYTDGTTETITSSRKIRNVGEGDCVSSCNCSNRPKWCGVRKLKLVSTKEIKPKKKVKEEATKTRTTHSYTNVND